MYIKINNIEIPATIDGKFKDIEWDDRESKTIHLFMSYADAKNLFCDGVAWSIVQRDEIPVYDEDGNPTGKTTTEETEFDNSDFCIAGDITEHRDGTVSIKMGKPTEAENAVGAVVALTGEVVTVERAAELRPMIEAAATSLPDGEAATAVELFPKWAYPVSYAVGDRAANGGKLYKCQHAHTSQADWTPDATPAMWAVIDKTHAGTLDDPIPASRGMEYEYGKYYLDGEDSKIYLCQRTGEAAGGTIVLQYMPHELVGNYFVEVS